MTTERPAPVTTMFYLSLVVALALSVVPLPPAADLFRPSWLAIIIAYWVLRQPQLCGLIAAWCAGLALDALHGTWLGQHALACTVVCALTHQFRLRMRVSPISQQVISVAFLAAIYEFVLMWVDGVAGLPTGGPERFAAVSGIPVVWPLLVAAGSLRIRATPA
jgi:rod shape-determining protein MreD